MIVSLAELINILKNRTKRKKIVLVTGCFDLLHLAHKEFLKAAKSKGDLLVIGLEQDKRVRQLKGKGRPVNSFNLRAENLLDLGITDLVFPMPLSFKKEDYFSLLQVIKPAVLAISENTPFLSLKKELIDKVGGQLYIFPFKPNFSTTKLLTKKDLSF